MSDVEFTTAVIAASGTASGAVDLGGGYMATELQFPAAFTGATVTFTTSNSLGGTYQTLQDKTGSAITYTVTQAKNTRLEPKDFWGVRYFKIVSASTEGSARTITVGKRQW